MTIIRFLTLSAAVAAFTAIASAQSSSQPANLVPTNLSLRGGVAVPIDSGLSNVGNTLIDIGVDYELNRSFFTNGTSYVSLDYFSASFRGNKGTVFPLMINQRFYTGTTGPGRRSYIYAGIGAVFIDVNTSNTVLGARGGIGVELGDALFFEAGLVLSDRADTARANALTFDLGYRF